MKQIVSNKYYLNDTDKYIMVNINITDKNISILYANYMQVYKQTAKDITTFLDAIDITIDNVLCKSFKYDTKWIIKLECKDKSVETSLDIGEDISVYSIVTNNNAGGVPMTVVDNNILKGEQTITIGEFPYIQPYKIDLDYYNVEYTKDGILYPQSQSGMSGLDITTITTATYDYYLETTKNPAGVSSLHDEALIRYVAKEPSNLKVDQIKLMVYRPDNIEENFKFYSVDYSSGTAVQTEHTAIQIEENISLYHAYLMFDFVDPIPMSRDIYICDSDGHMYINYMEFRTAKLV